MPGTAGTAGTGATAGATGTHALAAELETCSVPLCPGIELDLLRADLDLGLAARDFVTDGNAPYWAFCWASGHALARFVLEQPGWVRDRSVLDFGAGSGVVGIAAALAGARSVRAVDLDPAAREAIERNARRNGVTIEVCDTLPADWDLLLAADVCYEARNRSWLRSLAAAGRAGLVSDPGRWALPSDCLVALAHLEAATVPALDDDSAAVTIYRLDG